MASTVWKGQLAFGLLSLPVKLHSAARRESVSFNMLRKSDKSRLKQVLVAQADGESVPRSEIVKGYEYETGKYVVVDDAEIKKLESKRGRTVEVKEFVKAQDVNPIWLDESYYVAPGTAAGERVYALLYKALRVSGCVGVARIAMNSREHVVIVGAGDDGLVMHTMFYRDELRQLEEFRTDMTAVKDAELLMALKLIQRMRGAFEPQKYKDEFKASVMELIEERINMQNGAEKCINIQSGNASVASGGDDESGARERRASHGIDIMTALKRSLARDAGKRATRSTAGRVNASEKTHRNARRDAREASRDVARVGRANGAQKRQQSALGDPLSRDGGRGLAPQGTRAQALGNPNSRVS